MSDGAARKRPEEEARPPAKRRSGPLSRREREVFSLLADGLSGAQIAERLVLSPETVRTHIRNGMAKLGASTRSQAVVLALSRNEIAGGGQAAAPAPGGRADSAQVESALAHVVDGLISLWDVDAGWIYLARPDGLGLNRTVQRGRAPGLPESVALGEGVIGAAALERRAQILNAPGADGGAMVVAPLLHESKLVGVLALAVRPSRPTGRQELLLLQALAARLAELLGSEAPNLAAAADQALEGFRASWGAATRPA